MQGLLSVVFITAGALTSGSGKSFSSVLIASSTLAVAWLAFVIYIIVAVHRWTGPTAAGSSPDGAALQRLHKVLTDVVQPRYAGRNVNWTVCCAVPFRTLQFPLRSALLQAGAISSSNTSSGSTSQRQPFRFASPVRLWACVPVISNHSRCGLLLRFCSHTCASRCPLASCLMGGWQALPILLATRP
jgi:hypothetical protein